MPRAKSDRPNPYISAIQVAADTAQNQEEGAPEAARQALLQAGLAAMLQLYDMGMYGQYDLSEYQIKTPGQRPGARDWQIRGRG